jgi:glucose-1-phosphate adenylyltransferase
MNSAVTAIILGGGRGTRLYPLTLRRAKPAVGFAGKYRIIDIPMSNCINSGIKRIFVLTQFLSASLHRHIMRTYRFDEFTDGFVDILAAEQTEQRSDWFQGPADAVRATLNHTMYYQSELMLVLSGDQLYRMDFTELTRFHRESGADITICVCPVQKADASRMGLVGVGKKRVVERFVEKPTDDSVIDTFCVPPGLFGSGHDASSESFVASMGIYVFKPHVLSALLTGTTATDFGKGILQSALDICNVRAYPFSGYWRDIGTVDSFFEASISLAQPDPLFPLHAPRWPFYTRARSLPPSRIIGSEIRDSLIAEGAQVNYARVVDSIVGLRSVIGEGSTLSQVVLLGEDFYEGERLLNGQAEGDRQEPLIGIGRDCMVERAIIDKNVRIGDGVVIRAKPDVLNLEGEQYWVKDGITVIPKGTIIASGTVI